MRIRWRDPDRERRARQADLGMPELRQQGSEQDERGKKNLRLYRNPVLEPGKNPGDKRKSHASVIKKSLGNLRGFFLKPKKIFFNFVIKMNIIDE